MEEKSGQGAPFDEPLPHRENRPSPSYKPPSFPEGLFKELQETSAQLTKATNDNLLLTMKLQRARLLGNQLVSRIVTGLIVWAVFHACLWSWQKSTPMSAGQDAYSYIATAIKAGVFPSMDQLVAKTQQTQPPPAAPQPQPAPPTPAK